MQSVMEYHELANLFPMMCADDYAALLESMRSVGFDAAEPVIVYQGKILDGRNRHKAARELGIEPALAAYNGDDPLQYVIRRNLARRHLNETQRGVVAAKMANMGAGRNWNNSANLPNNKVTQSAAAAMLNVSERTIRTVKAVERAAPELLARMEAGEMTAHEAEQIIKGKPHVSHNSGQNEWYTPAEYISAARAVMGGIDLDPASSHVAQETVKAKAYLTAKDDGLAHEWRGRVWMNPPYSSDLIGDFCSKLTGHVADGDVSQACVLVNNATDTGWFHGLLEHAAAVCLVRGRIRFIDMDGNPSGAPLQGQAVLYFGKNGEKFAREFAQFGRVLWNAA